MKSKWNRCPPSVGAIEVGFWQYLCKEAQGTMRLLHAPLVESTEREPASETEQDFTEKRPWWRRFFPAGVQCRETARDRNVPKYSKISGKNRQFLVEAAMTGRRLWSWCVDHPDRAILLALGSGLLTIAAFATVQIHDVQEIASLVVTLLFAAGAFGLWRLHDIWEEERNTRRRDMSC